MPEAAHSKRVNRALDALRALPDPLVRLDAVREAVEQVQRLEASAVTQARESGATWSEIGAVYGLTKQGAQQRFHPSSRATRD
jgi:hypothetical protein